MEKKVERQTMYLFLDGELDLNNAQSLRNVIDRDIDKKGIKTVIINMENVKFIDSSGLGMILGRYKKLLTLGGKLKIVNAPPHVYKIMEMAGLPKIIQFEKDETA
ncbi:anti-sigma-factor antagonist [Syntrophobotulus glycolicus DSM 8271]|uniref:Anti-sigma factor antagonist n=1 Tax=Syntrophobotulus glycolicus (strain DSM 8271 / FlGlyR) TaxID=645991 RepID=F0T073_SYNGF|nr:anti-sigma factor antagonist [Syntrophobotulus glycolicus]ADY56160.1 anti-sigma-factor antagonist [Syntrophobotulus glycolicus DSM 8271]